MEPSAEFNFLVHTLKDQDQTNVQRTVSNIARGSQQRFPEVQFDGFGFSLDEIQRHDEKSRLVEDALRT